MPRRLIIDASLSPRISTELKRRGRDAKSVAEVANRALKDPALLSFLASALADQEWTLITADDAMPGEHADIIAEHRITVATVDGHWKHTGYDREAFKWEVVQRHAHKMAEQELGTCRRYGLNGHRVWTPRR